MSTVVDRALDEAIDIVAATEQRARALVRRCVAAVSAPEPDVDELADCLRACCSYNEDIRDSARRICTLLNSLDAGDDDWSIKAVARRLRPALTVLAHPHRYTAGEYIRAVRAVDDVAAVKDREWLLSDSMLHELRGRAFGALRSHLHRDPDVVGVAGATIAGHPHPDAVAVA